MFKKTYVVIISLLAISLAACASTTPRSSSTTTVSTAPLEKQSVPAMQPVSSAPTDRVATTISSQSYPIVDTAQSKCYNASVEIPCSSSSFAGQDAQYEGNAPHYQDNGDGTVTDLVTGLMWQQDPGTKMTFDQAVEGAASFDLAGYHDWRLPTIKELYSLILLDGTDVSVCAHGTCTATPFIDTRYFKFSYGDASAGERMIDSQFASSTKYLGTVMDDREGTFGVNFADGRIKGYPIAYPTNKTFYVLYVRGSSGYGQNSFVDNGDATITDNATGLTWQQSDSGAGMDWQAALSYCEDLNFAGASDWRLPNAKELQSIVDYSRSPDTTHSAAIDPVFNVSAITDEAGQTDYPFYWSSSTHIDSSGQGSTAAYVAFGKALGYWNDAWRDVHGAGAQRSDPKTGSAADYPQGHGPQNDAVRVNNYVRCVRGGNVTLVTSGIASTARPSQQVISTGNPDNQPSRVPGQNGQGQPGGMPGQGNSQSGALGDQEQTPMSGPPQTAINACATSSQSSACQFTTPKGLLNGSCQFIQQQLACVPSNRP